MPPAHDGPDAGRLMMADLRLFRWDSTESGRIPWTRLLIGLDLSGCMRRNRPQRDVTGATFNPDPRL